MSDGFELFSGCAELREDKKALRDSHAEFVRRVREVAERAIRRRSDTHNAIGEINTISALCDAEQAKEQP